MRYDHSRFTRPRRITLQAGDSHVLRAQLAIGSDAWATPSNVASLQATLYRQGAASNPVYQADLTVGDVVLVSFVTDDDQWLDDTNDSRTQKGYNLKWTIPGSAVAESGWYTIEIKCTDTQDRVTRLVFEGPAMAGLT